MRIRLQNCVTNPKYKDLRKAGNPVFKPSILGQVLMPSAIRIVMSEDFEQQDVVYLESLVKSGSCIATEVGVGPVNFSAWLSSFSSEQSIEIAEPEVEDAVEEIEEPEEEESEEEVEEPQEEELAEEIEEIIEEESIIYTESELNAMRNSDLRDIALSMDPEAGVSNKSKKKLVSLILELQNG